MTRHLAGCGPKAARTPPVPYLPPHTRRRVAALTLALGGFVWASCGRGGEPGPGVPDPEQPTYLARGPVCFPETYPEWLPRPDALVDVPRLIAAMGELADSAAGYVLLSVEFDQNGVMSRRDVLEHSTTEAVADAVWRLVGEAGREAEETDRAWGVRLRVELAGDVGLAVGRREFCRPVARNPELDRAMQQYTPPGTRVRREVRVETVHMRVYVSDLGTVTEATIVRGGYSGSSIERHLSLFLQQFLFNPATIDGEPTGAWVEIPVHVRMPA